MNLSLSIRINSSEVTLYDYVANSSKNFINPVKKSWKCKKRQNSGKGGDFVQVTEESNMKVMASAHFLKKEYPNFDNFSFEITHDHHCYDLLIWRQFQIDQSESHKGGGIMPVSYDSKLLASSAFISQKHVRFGQIGKIFESWIRFQLAKFSQNYFPRSLKTLKN